MYRTSITLTAILMICGTAMAAEPASDNSPKTIAPAVTGNETTPVVDIVIDNTIDGKAKLVEEIKKKRKIRNRLPNFYRAIVTEEQKAEIYKIQQEYLPQIHELQQKIKKLRAEQKAKIKAVLTPEQKKQLEEKIEEAKKKHKLRAEARKVLRAEKAAEE